ncbi:hypothetical protein G7K_3208-t1 [Saitoella complicata NRRL Y-17804]|uniref:Uncharacterized protein n=1 Tax=Saitoella complicata (strain BCRC 22490 / CBS 7301 / JCM 7358 / NBRC 10748 / NRRL Y-17804) TaxID=698492 RepID=A0A0E9NGP1_SAICN|nr:hypothetical protein G7K_3208-t1 [Saitoella complicata NRRL Y-17804]
MVVPTLSTFRFKLHIWCWRNTLGFWMGYKNAKSLYILSIWGLMDGWLLHGSLLRTVPEVAIYGFVTSEKDFIGTVSRRVTWTLKEQRLLPEPEEPRQSLEADDQR